MRKQDREQQQDDGYLVVAAVDQQEQASRQERERGDVVEQDHLKFLNRPVLGEGACLKGRSNEGIIT